VKQKKPVAAKRRPKTAGALRAKQTVRAARPWHKRVLLHPFVVMVLLCAGVLIIGTTWRGAAASYTITATVPAQLPPIAATITSPGSQQRFSTAQATVAGSCPAQSYVKLFRNTAFSGAAQCTGNTYQIQTNLVTGGNELNAQVYNLTDQAGPAGAPVTVYYDQTTETPPAAPTNVPTTMWVANVDSNGYKQGAATRASDNPTVSGWAPPWSMLTVTFHSDPQMCVTQANGIGWWSCTLGRTLPSGVHRVDVSAVTTGGQTLTFPAFQITVLSSLATILAPASGTAPLAIHADYQYQLRLGRQAADFAVSLSGGTAPYTVSADWGDGTTTTQTRNDAAPFTVSHAYATPSGPNKSYTVLIRAVDARGGAAVMQLSAVVKGDGILLVSSSTPVGGFLDGLHHWLWLVWPAYVVVVLMAVGYYLGEREEYRHLMTKPRPPRIRKAR
jgi:hypothetical protein